MTNSINIDLTVLTSRVDSLQSGLSALQGQLTQIKDTIPVNLPEFTDPIPVNIQNPSQEVDLTGITALLTQIKEAIEQQTVDPNPTNPMFEPLTLTAQNLSQVGWNDQQPTTLEALVDGNPETSTGWGRIMGGGNRGYIEADTGTVNRYYYELKAGIKMGAGYESGYAVFFGESSESSSQTIPFWYMQSQPNQLNTERITTFSGFLFGRYLRLGALDIGFGRPEVRGYSLKIWRFTGAI